MLRRVRVGASLVDSYVTDFDERPPLEMPGRDGALNRALRQIGVCVDGFADECAAVGFAW